MFSNAAGSRSYKLYVPSLHDGQPCPLIVMLHGCTQSADDFAAGTRMNFAAETHGASSSIRSRPQAANASEMLELVQRRATKSVGGGEPSLIAGITQQIMQRLQHRSAARLRGGLSAGGAAAAIMGETYPDLYAAVGVHSGLACGAAHDMPSAFSAMRGQAVAQNGDQGRAGMQPMPTIVFHGDQDSTVHPNNGSKVIERAVGRSRIEGCNHTEDRQVRASLLAHHQV